MWQEMAAFFVYVAFELAYLNGCLDGHGVRWFMQLALDFPVKKTRGGARKGAGRKGRGDRVGHATRVHEAKYPVHVTVKALQGVASLRGHQLKKLVCRHFRDVLDRHPGFRVVHFSVQGNHIHLLAEADSALALSRGMLGLLSGLARKINNRLGRSGKLWRDRYHAHELTNPTMTRNALRYLLQNTAHHGGPVGIDPCSSATWFDGFTDHAPATHGSPVARPTIWLLLHGWHEKGGGKLSIHERPAE
jgi:REP element-mobilizing transposase RayT